MTDREHWCCLSIDCVAGRGRVATRCSTYRARVEFACKLGAWLFDGPKPVVDSVDSESWYAILSTAARSVLRNRVTKRRLSIHHGARHVVLPVTHVAQGCDVRTRVARRPQSLIAGREAHLISRACVILCVVAPTAWLNMRYCRTFQEPRAFMTGWMREHGVGGCGLW